MVTRRRISQPPTAESAAISTFQTGKISRCRRRRRRSLYNADLLPRFAPVINDYYPLTNITGHDELSLNKYVNYPIRHIVSLANTAPLLMDSSWGTYCEGIWRRVELPFSRVESVRPRSVVR